MHCVPGVSFHDQSRDINPICTCLLRVVEGVAKHLGDDAGRAEAHGCLFLFWGSSLRVRCRGGDQSMDRSIAFCKQASLLRQLKPPMHTHTNAHTPIYTRTSAIDPKNGPSTSAVIARQPSFLAPISAGRSNLARTMRRMWTVITLGGLRFEWGRG